MTQLILFNVFNGLIVGAFYALMALGLSLILNLSGVINFAHGGFLAIGGYLAYTLIPYIGFWGALIVAPFLTGAIGLAVERVLIRRSTGAIRSTACCSPSAWPSSSRTARASSGVRKPAVPGSRWLDAAEHEYFFLTGYRLFMVVIVAVAVLGAVPRS